MNLTKHTVSGDTETNFAVYYALRPLNDTLIGPNHLLFGTRDLALANVIEPSHLVVVQVEVPCELKALPLHFYTTDYFECHTIH